MMVIYPVLSRATFRVFACRQLDVDESWHQDDTSINCADGSHQAFQVLAFFFVLLYPLGIPAGFLGIMLYNRDRIMRDYEEEEKGNPIAEEEPADSWYVGGKLKFTFLVADYTKTTYFYECIDLMRKLLLTGLVVFAERGKIFQIMITICGYRSASSACSCTSSHTHPRKQTL